MTAEIYPTTTALVIADVIILQDIHGRYNLNGLHQASGGAETKRPSDWLRRKTTQALVSELGTQVENLPLDVITGGNHAGTYVHELLAVSYAAWISPAFQLKVNQAFLDRNREIPATSAVVLLPSYQAQVEDFRLCATFLGELGMLEDRDRLMLADMARTAVYSHHQVHGEGVLALPMPRGFFLADRVKQLGYALARKQEASLLSSGLARQVAREYRQRHGTEPQKSSRFVDGAVRPVNWYVNDEAPWIDILIQAACAQKGFILISG